MIELTDTAPVVDIQPAEYNRLLGYPPGWVLEGRAQELADMARELVCGERPAVGLRAPGGEASH
jgi:hypothetical protein